MRTRTLRFDVYADEAGVAWVTGIVQEAVVARRAHLVRLSVVKRGAGSGQPTADEDGGGGEGDILAEQWAHEHPGQDSGTRTSVELCVRVRCSLRTRRALRKAVLDALCPAGPAPHICRVPWSVGL
ncbi:hypothetical protein ABZY44_33720 [Streptomyces sp. NPDC006544]|uniref:hypothetical protein n=1 Tax=Streptomyces sp. NPDC006544 TaxID=3154583 RepID=UPI0033BB7C8F